MDVVVVTDSDGVFGVFTDETAAALAVGKAVLAGMCFNNIRLETTRVQSMDILNDVLKASDVLWDSDGDRWERVPDSDLWHCPGDHALDNFTYDKLCDSFGPLSASAPTTLD